MRDMELKVWGHTQHLVDSAYYARHDIVVVPGGYCSLHMHEERANTITILTGELNVLFMHGPTVTRRVVRPTESVTIPSFVPHLFFSGGCQCQAIEEYFPDRGGRVRYDDIVRMFDGGLADADQILNVIAGKIHELNDSSQF